NIRDQVVGHTCDEEQALLWTNGRQYALNSLIRPSNIELTVANFINAQGQIAAIGRLPNGDQHVFLLNPTNARPPTASTGTLGHPSIEQHVLNRFLRSSARARAIR